MNVIKHDGSIDVPGYVSIDLQALRPGSDIDFDLYIAEDDQLVLYRSASLAFDADDVARLERGGARYVFTDLAHADHASRYFERNLPGILSDHAVPTAAKARTSVFAAEGLAREVLENPTSENLQRGKLLIGALTQFGITSTLAARQLVRAISSRGSLDVHSTNTAVYALAMGGRESVTSLERIADLTLGAYFHDIGMIEVPPAVLERRGPLTAAEWAAVRCHPEAGARLIAEAQVFSPQVELGVRMHHERIDGEGYPDGARGADIPWEARVIAVAEVFDALTSDRPYREPVRSYHAIQLMLDGESGALDRDVIRDLIPALSRELPGVEGTDRPPTV